MSVCDLYSCALLTPYRAGCIAATHKQKYVTHPTTILWEIYFCSQWYSYHFSLLFRATSSSLVSNITIWTGPHWIRSIWQVESCEWVSYPVPRITSKHNRHDIFAATTNPTLTFNGTELNLYTMQKNKSECKHVYSQTIDLLSYSSLSLPQASTTSMNPKQVTNIDPYGRIPSFSMMTSLSKLLCKADPSMSALTLLLYLSHSPLLTSHS